MENTKKKYLTRERMFGYSLWNTEEKPIYDSFLGIFKYKQKHFLPFEREFISKHFVATMFGRDFSLKEGECVEIKITF